MTDQKTIDGLKELLCFNVYSLHRSFGRFYQAAFSETGLTYPKFVVLMVLEAEGAMSISALSARAGVEPNTLSPLVKKMADFGAITRQRTLEDERKVQLSITPKGREVLARAQKVIAQGFMELGLDARQMAESMRFLESARHLVDQATPPKLSLDGIG